jgi:hypothetical protein
MKLLDNSGFEQLSEHLSTEETSIDGRIEARLESFSCKLTSEDKKLSTQLLRKRGVSAHDLAALSPPSTANIPPPSLRARTFSQSSNDEGGLTRACSRKTLFYLISTLNQSYRPDYEFSEAKSDDFSLEPSISWVKKFIDSTLTASLREKYTLAREQLWAALEREINLGECEVYSYNPDVDNDPIHDEPSIWSFSFFFYNKRLKRIVFFCVRAVSPFLDLDDDDFAAGEDLSEGLNAPEVCY